MRVSVCIQEKCEGYESHLWAGGNLLNGSLVELSRVSLELAKPVLALHTSARTAVATRATGLEVAPLNRSVGLSSPGGVGSDGSLRDIVLEDNDVLVGNLLTVVGAGVGKDRDGNVEKAEETHLEDV